MIGKFGDDRIRCTMRLCRYYYCYKCDRVWMCDEYLHQEQDMELWRYTSGFKLSKRSVILPVYYQSIWGAVMRLILIGSCQADDGIEGSGSTIIRRASLVQVLFLDSSGDVKTVNGVFRHLYSRNLLELYLRCITCSMPLVIVLNFIICPCSVSC